MQTNSANRETGDGLLRGTPIARQSMQSDDLLLRETNHRCSNDLQLVVSLLALQSRRATSDETRQALADAMERVAVLARCRSTLYRDRHLSLKAALRQVCEALHAQAEPRSIRVFLTVAQEVDGLSSTEITTLALVVNELATNAIKHAYEEGKSGQIEVTLDRNAGGDVTVTVDDDGLPFPESKYAAADGLGLGLTKRLMASIDGLLIMPPPGGKAFELRVPVQHV
ncbi:sensor histidine kinase [Sphingomonas bacterium]|uniref:sensor histidine kinase n=1 Tax=Sphingomonas bacterium TaxID=1895847 RepID=UPI0020C6440C|nr:sensor histidine kinase [Sphingomonas bacterium]